uniref:Mono-ADP ribosylhydrolase 1 n=1 Tax=Cyprinus carpio TaxID=7962 RepID=A0A8C1TXH2_CYPCA
MAFQMSKHAAKCCPPRGSYVKQTGGRRFPRPQSPRVEGLLRHSLKFLNKNKMTSFLFIHSSYLSLVEKLYSVDKENRSEMYRVDFIPLEKSPSGDSSCKPWYQVNEQLNKKISLFSGDITKLEIDAIANAVDGAIHRGAGPLLRKECGTLNGCETGEAKITGAYGLRMLFTPWGNCYYNCLHTPTKNHLRTVAFPCISTGVYGYPPDQAVEVALRTVREYLEQNHEKLDRVIFCAFLKSDKELYETMLPAYFPQGSPPKSKL